MTLPEMVFGGSRLEISNKELGVKFDFNAYDALKACGKQAGIQVWPILSPRSLSPCAHAHIGM